MLEPTTLFSCPLFADYYSNKKQGIKDEYGETNLSSYTGLAHINFFICNIKAL